jgi:hypothetical protein
LNETNETLTDINEWIAQLATQKRPMFAYEQEVRIIHVEDYSAILNPNKKMLGTEIDWDPELHIEKIWTHPKADFWFIQVVEEIVRKLAPRLYNNDSLIVLPSKMTYSPPF